MQQKGVRNTLHRVAQLNYMIQNFMYKNYSYCSKLLIKLVNPKLTTNGDKKHPVFANDKISYECHADGKVKKKKKISIKINWSGEI